MPNIVIVLSVSGKLIQFGILDSTLLNNFKLLEKFFCSNSLSLEYKMANESQMENDNFHVSLIEYFETSNCSTPNCLVFRIVRNVPEVHALR